MATGIPDLNNLGIDGIKANLWANQECELRHYRVQLRKLSRSSDFSGFKYLVEEKIGKENSITIIISQQIDINIIHNFQILTYIIDELKINIFEIIDVNYFIEPIIFAFLHGSVETFKFYKKHYDIYNTPFINRYFQEIRLERDISDLDIDHFVFLLELFDIDLKKEIYSGEFEVMCVLDEILIQITPNRKLIELIIKQKAGYLLSKNRPEITWLMNCDYAGSGWARSLS